MGEQMTSVKRCSTSPDLRLTMKGGGTMTHTLKSLAGLCAGVALVAAYVIPRLFG